LLTEALAISAWIAADPRVYSLRSSYDTKMRVVHWPAQSFDQALAERFARLALDCIHREYPNKITHHMNSDGDAKPPRKLTPAFYGCYDWHSAVHGHWLLVRLARLFPKASFAAPARRAIAQSLTAANISLEVEYLAGEGRKTFERPYGLAWLLQLAAEVHEWDDADARHWSVCLGPLAQAATGRIAAWVPKLEYPVRSGEHSNTAFALSLMLDYARISGNAAFGRLLASRAWDYYLKDKDCPLTYEPSGEDFLSPCLAEADVMRRILSAEEFAKWFDGFLPHLAVQHLEPTPIRDVRDGKLYHLAGLNLSRSWMLEGILSKLPTVDARQQLLADVASRLMQAGLDSIKSEYYEGGHWLGTFAVYLLSGRGLS
jgi:hypothetical protein